MHIAFRADSSSEIGSGHIYRCVSLATQIQSFFPNEAIKPIFIMKNLRGSFSHVVDSAGFITQFIDEKLSEEEDADETLNILKNYQCNSLILDHYFLNLSFEKKIKEQMNFIVIDDLVNRKHLCNILIDQNFKVDYSESYCEQVDKDCRLFLGPQYALLRDQFYEASNRYKPIEDHIQNVLIFFGGSDPDGYTLNFIKAIKDVKSNLTFNVLVSSKNAHITSIRNEKLFPNIKLLIDPPELASVMLQNQFYFGSGGSVTWERMAVGLNGAITIVAENQRPIAEELQKAGLQEYWGEASKIDFKNIPVKIETMNDMIDKLNERAKLCRSMINKASLAKMLNAILDNFQTRE